MPTTQALTTTTTQSHHPHPFRSGTITTTMSTTKQQVIGKIAEVSFIIIMAMITALHERLHARLPEVISHKIDDDGEMTKLKLKRTKQSFCFSYYTYLSINYVLQQMHFLDIFDYYFNSSLYLSLPLHTIAFPFYISYDISMI